MSSFPKNPNRIPLVSSHISGKAKLIPVADHTSQDFHQNAPVNSVQNVSLLTKPLQLYWSVQLWANHVCVI